MLQETFQKLQDARRAKSKTALVTRIEDGTQCLVINGKTDGQLELTDTQKSEVLSRIESDKSGLFADGALFAHIHNPPLRMIIVGAVHISQALAPMAKLSGYEVTVIDPRSTFATEERFPGITLNDDWPDEAMEALAPDVKTAVVTLTHDPKLDDPALEVALKSDAFYITSLGSTRTHGKRVARLKDAGFTDAEIARINAPAGMDIGAVSPAEIAISIMAELTAVKHGKSTTLMAAEAAE